MTESYMKEVEAAFWTKEPTLTLRASLTDGKGMSVKHFIHVTVKSNMLCKWDAEQNYQWQHSTIH